MRGQRRCPAYNAQQQMKNEFNCLNLLLCFKDSLLFQKGTPEGWLQKGKQEKENDNLMLGGETLSKILYSVMMETKVKTGLWNFLLLLQIRQFIPTQTKNEITFQKSKACINFI